MRVIDVPASAGVAWIKLSFALFRAQPAGWISLVSSWLLATFGMFFIPLIGPAIATILVPGFFAGFVIAARNQEAGQPVGVHQLLAGFRANGRALVAIGGLTLFAEVVVLMLLALLGFPRTIPADANGMPDMVAYMQLLDGKEWIVMLGAALLLAVKAALWFTAAILALNQMPASHALRWSCYALIANVLPMFVFGGLIAVVFMFAALPWFLGMLVALPLFAIAHYVSYRDLFRVSAET